MTIGLLILFLICVLILFFGWKFMLTYDKNTDTGIKFLTSILAIIITLIGGVSLFIIYVWPPLLHILSYKIY
jgi:hypothetical protein